MIIACVGSRLLEHEPSQTSQNAAMRRCQPPLFFISLPPRSGERERERERERDGSGETEVVRRKGRHHFRAKMSLMCVRCPRWERERERERRKWWDGSDVTIVALKVAMSLHFPWPKIRTWRERRKLIPNFARQWWHHFRLTTSVSPLPSLPLSRRAHAHLAHSIGSASPLPM